MRELALRHGSGRTRIVVGQGLLGGLGGYVGGAGPVSGVAVVTNPAVQALLGAIVSRSLDASGIRHATVPIPDAESAKSLDTVGAVCSRLSSEGFDRDCAVVGLGGGVVGDVAGFVAATYMRGVRLVQVPTTLLAQVDSAIGGKSGVNLPEGKNLVGAFHHPDAVVSDVLALGTLAERDYLSGVAETAKCWVVGGDDAFPGVGEREWRALLAREPGAVEAFVAACASLKVRLVEADERDRGERMALNLGHTLGHALEVSSSYGVSHGEAVAIGTVFASRISRRMGMLPEPDLRRIEGLLASLGLPVGIGKGHDARRLLELMRSDKKARGGRLRLVLPARIGQVVVSDGVDERLALETAEGMMA